MFEPHPFPWGRQPTAPQPPSAPRRQAQVSAACQTRHHRDTFPFIFRFIYFFSHLLSAATVPASSNRQSRRLRASSRALGPGSCFQSSRSPLLSAMGARRTAESCRSRDRPSFPSPPAVPRKLFESQLCPSGCRQLLLLLPGDR